MIARCATSRLRALAAVVTACVPCARVAAQDAPPAPRPETRWFDIGAITLGRTPFVRVERPWYGDFERDEPHGNETDSRFRPFGAAVDVIEWLRSTGPASLGGEGTSWANFGERLLRVTAPADALEEVRTVLHELARVASTTFSIDVAVFSGDTTQVAGSPLAIGPSLTPLASARACGTLGQSVAARQGKEQAYVADYRPAVRKGVAASEPWVEIGHEGLAFDAVVHRSTPDRIRLHVSAWWGRARETRAFQLKGSGEIRLPDVDVRTSAATLDVVPGAWSLLPSAGVGSEGVVFAVRARQYADEARPGSHRPRPRVPTIPLTERGGGREGQRSLATYDVADLAARADKVPVRFVGLLSSGGTAPSPELDEPAPAFPSDSLVDVMHLTEPLLLDPAVSVELYASTLRVLADAERQQVVARTLDDIRAVSLVVPTVRATVVRVPLTSLPEVWTGLDDSLVRDGGVALAARAGASEVDRLSAHAANGARCASASGRDRAYLERYDVDVVDGAAVGSPVGRRFFEGTVLDVEARPTPDRGAVVCELRLDRSDALSIDRVPTPYGELETPSLRITRMHGSLTVPTGSTRIAVANVDGQFVTLVLLSASID